MAEFNYQEINVPTTHGEVRSMINANFGRVQDFARSVHEELLALRQNIHPLIVGRAVPTKARKGSRYYFQDGVVKLKVGNPEIADVPYSVEKRAALSAIIQTIRSEGGILLSELDKSYANHKTCLFTLPSTFSQEWSEFPYLGNMGKEKAVVATVLSDEWPITFSKLKIETIAREMVVHANTASPFMHLRYGIIYRERPISAYEAYFCNGAYHIYAKRCRKLRYARKGDSGFSKTRFSKRNVWTRSKDGFRRGKRHKVYPIVRKRRCQNSIEFYVTGRLDSNVLP